MRQDHLFDCSNMSNEIFDSFELHEDASEYEKICEKRAKQLKADMKKL